MILLLLQVVKARRCCGAGTGTSGRSWFGIDGGFQSEHVLAVLYKVEEIAGLGLGTPSLDVGAADLAVGVHVGSLADEHVWRGDDKGERGLAWIVARDPECDGDVVRVAAELDGDGAGEGEEELGAAIVEGEYLRLGREGRDGNQGAVDVSIDVVCVLVGRKDLPQPSLHYGVVHEGRGRDGERETVWEREEGRG